jgi:hypothetical protein
MATALAIGFMSSAVSNAAITSATSRSAARYIDESWQALQPVLATVQSVADSTLVTQREVDAAPAPLNDALKAQVALPIYTLRSDTPVITAGSKVTLTLTGELNYPVPPALCMLIKARKLTYRSSTIPGLTSVSTTLPDITTVLPDTPGCDVDNANSAPVFGFQIPSNATPGVYMLSSLRYDKTTVTQKNPVPAPPTSPTRATTDYVNFTTSNQSQYPGFPLEVPITIFGYNNPTDLTTLITQIAQGGSLSAADYTYASWTTLQSALAAAQAALDDVTSTQDALDTAKSNLQTAFDALLPLAAATITVSDLQALITVSTNLSIADYVADSAWNALQVKLTAAQHVANNAGATTDAIKTAYSDLTVALAALKVSHTWNVAFTVADSDTATLEFHAVTGFDAVGYALTAAAALPATQTTTGGKTNYSLTLRDGTYCASGTSELYAATGSGSKVATDIGQACFSVPSENSSFANKTDVINLRIHSVYADQSFNGAPLVAGGDYTLALKDSAEHSVRLGAIHRIDSGATARTAIAVPAIAGLDAGYRMVIIPSAQLSRAFADTTYTNFDVGSVVVPVQLERLYALTAPSTANALFYTQNHYFANLPSAPLRTENNGDATTTYLFGAGAASSSFIWRVSEPGKVTKAGWGLPESGTVVTFEADEFPGDPVTTMLADRDGNSLLMNIPGGSNQLQLAVADVFKLRVFRMWEIVNGDTANKMIEPDFHFRFLAGADVLTLTSPDALNSNWVNITAEKAGTAIIEVSYDAIDVFGSNYNPSDGRFGASNPERKGLVVVTVAEAADSDFSFAVKKPGSADFSAWDAEFDTWFFAGASKEIEIRTDDGAASVSAWNPDVPSSLHPVIDGKLTIYPGNNIVKVVSDGLVNYQVIRGGSVQIVPDVTGHDFNVGDKVQVRYGGGIPAYPLPKMSGIYNPVVYTRLAYLADEITLTQEMIDGTEPLRAGGSIADSHYGQAAGAHRTLTYDTGISVDMNAGSSTGSYTVLPSVYLVTASQVAKAALASTVADATSLVAANYTAASWATFVAAFGAAQAALIAELATQSVVDDAVAVLKAAVAALVKVSAAASMVPSIVPVDSATPVKPTESVGVQDYGTVSVDWVFSVSGGSVTARFDAPIESFVRITLNAVPVAPADYDVAKGSTIVTLHADFLATLPAGVHIFMVEFDDGMAQLSVNISDDLESPDRSSTGGSLAVGSGSVIPMAGVLLLFGATFIGVVFGRRKQLFD